MMIISSILQRKRLRLSLAFTFLFLASMSLLNSCMQMRTSNTATLKKLDKSGAKNEIIQYQPSSYDFSVRTVKSQVSSNNRAVFFIHGAPGSSNAFYDYLKDSTLLSKAALYSVDRVGYGYSRFGKAMTSIAEQSKIISELIDSIVTENEVIVVGHSFGGPIAAYVSLLNPKITHSILLAPANAPEHEKFFWFSYIAKWKITKWLLPYTFQVSGDEKFSHEQELREIEFIWPQIDVPTLQIHGKKDALVPFENLEWTRAKIDSSLFDQIIFEKENHFLPWTQKEVIVEELLKRL